MEKIVIIIPTYNEKDNIERMIDVLENDVFPKIKDFKMSILIVDDNSPDGTGELVKEKQQEYENLHLLSGEKKGLGVAYVRGMKHAMKKLNADWVVEMDGDFQHDPHALVAMVKKAKKGYDYVIGSRYIEGGSIPKEWELYRKFLSFFGSLFARVVLWMPDIHDMTSGYKMTRVDGFLNKIKMDKILEEEYLAHYAYKIYLLYLIIKQGAKATEVPIVFHNREEGESKMPKNNIKDSLRLVLTLRMKESMRFIKVCMVGTAGAAVQFTFFNLLRTRIKPEIANTIAVEMAIIANFIINNSWTFKDKKLSADKSIKKLLLKFAQFNLFSLGSLLIQFVVMKIGTGMFGRGFIIENLLVVVGILLGLVYNFTIYTRLIWKTKQ
jgi:dolichol-phosphate mannosyltransferase